MIAVADKVVDMGLGAGEQGGRVIFSGTLAQLLQDPRSLTAKYLRDELAIPVPATRRRPAEPAAERARRLRAQPEEHRRRDSARDADVRHRRQRVGQEHASCTTCSTPRSSARKGDWDRRVGTHRKLEGAEFVTDVILVDQAPIGRTPRSNPVTYLKAFDPIRELFASTKDAEGARPDREPLLVQRARRPLRGVRGRRRRSRSRCSSSPTSSCRARCATASASSRRCSK